MPRLLASEVSTAVRSLPVFSPCQRPSIFSEDVRTDGSSHRCRIHRKQARLDRHHEEHRRVLRLQGHPLQCHCCWCDGYQYFPISRTVGSQHGGPGNVDEALYDNASCLIFWSYSQVLTHVLDPGMKGEDFVEVSKVAEIALFLCSDAAQVVNGAVWTADGGVTAH